MNNYHIDGQIADTMRYLYNMGTVIQSHVKSVIEDYIINDLIPVLEEESPEDTGNYKKGWTYKPPAKNGKTYVVYNENRPDLTYILEFGMERRKKMKDGSIRVIAHSSFPHMKRALERTQHILEQKLRNIGG